MMVSSGCIPMCKNGTSIWYLDEWYFNKCFRRKKQKKRYIELYCYLRRRYLSPLEEISWRQRYASAEPSKAWKICHGTRFDGCKAQSFRWQPPVAHKWRPLRRRQPSKTGIHAIQKYCGTEISFFFSEFLISSYVSRRSNKDAKDLQEFNIFSDLLRKSKINTKFVLRSES